MNANAPLSEQFRLAAKDWVDKDSAASMLEETKSAVLSQRMAALGDMAVSKAELAVKATPEWADHVASIVKARESANLAKVKMEWIRMRFNEWQSDAATKRAEMKL